jgi:hypothetical protein
MDFVVPCLDYSPLRYQNSGMAEGGRETMRLYDTG